MSADAESESVQQIIQVLGYLRGSKEERIGALEIIAPYSGTEESRKVFRSTEACKELLRLLPEQDAITTTSALKCLINFSQEEFFIKQLIELNVAFRINDLLNENVKQDLKNENLSGQEQTNSAKLKAGEGVFELVKKDIQLDSKTGKIIKEDPTEQIIEYCFMLLSNLSASESGQKHILGLEGEGKFKFIIAESIFGMFCYFTKNTSFDFVANIMANLACLNEGRKFMIDHKYIEAIVVQMVTKYMNAHRRKYLMTCLRNLFFEYQTYEGKFLEMNVPRDICKVLIDEQGLMDSLPETWVKWKAKMPKSEEDIDMQNTSYMIDALVLLANSTPLLKRMHQINVQSLLPLIKLPENEEWEDVRLRLQVLEQQLETADQLDENAKEAQEAEAEEKEEQLPALEAQ